MTSFEGRQERDASGAPMVLNRLSEPVLAGLMGLAKPVSYPAGAVVLQEGSLTPFLGVIEDGRVALRLRVPERGESITIATVEAGELLGWSAAVPPFRATVDAVATEPTTLLAFDAAALRSTIAADCELAAELLPLILESVSTRLGASWSQLLDLFGSRAHEPW